jgi:hypothetical protein
MHEHPRIEPLDLDRLDPRLQEMAGKWRAQGGDDHVMRTLAHAPEFVEPFVSFYSPLVRHGRVEHRTKELARLRLAMLNDCHY